MGCVCIQKLKTAVENLKMLPLATLASLIPPDLPTAQMSRLSTALMSSAHASASATARAQAQMMARLAASAQLSASLDMSAVAQLEAMAQMQQAFGVSPFSANASVQLGLAIKSMNVNLPPLLAVLMDYLAPLAEKLAELAAVLSTSIVVNHTLGLDLAQPGAVAKLQAALHASATAAASASATATASATMKLAAHMRLVVAARVLGIDLLAPGGTAKLSAAISASAKLGLPALTVNLGQMGATASALGQISAAQTALNIKLAAPNAASLLAAALAPLLAGVNMAAGLNLGVSAAVSSSVSAAAQAAFAASQSASASAQAKIQALAAVDFRGMSLPPLPNLGNLSLAATLTEQLSAATGVATMQQHPCSSCPVAGAF